MEGIREYFLHVITGAMICSLVMSLPRTGSAGELIRLLCGVFMAVTILAPMKNMDLQLTESILPDLQQAKAQAAEGKNMAREAREDIIKSSLEAYVLDKAAQLGEDIAVEITLSQEELPVPEEAELRGHVSLDSREKLKQILRDDLGIGEEDQHWIG